MKKILLMIVIFLMFPLICFAESNAEVKSITFVEKSENTKVASEATTDGEKINLDLIFYDQGDYATYDVVVKNKASEKLFINGDIFKSDDEHISYGFSYDGNKNYIEPGEEQTITIKAVYSKAIEKEEFGSGGLYEASTTEPLILSNKLLSVPNTLKNLGILGKLFIIAVIVCVVVGLYISIKNVKNKEMLTLIIGVAIIVVPYIASALLTLEIPVEATITIKKVKDNSCEFIGTLNAGATHVEGQYTYKYKQQRTYSGWEDIEADGWGMALTDRDSTDPVTSKMCTSIGGKPVVSLSAAFVNSKATSIDLSSFDTSNVKNMTETFRYVGQDASEIELIDIEYLDTSNVTNMTAIFHNYGLRTTAPIDLDLTKWDTHSVTEFDYAFTYFGKDSTDKINLNISGWDLRNVSSFSYVFSTMGEKTPEVYANLSNIKLDPTKLTSLRYLFAEFASGSKKTILDVTGWDTSGVTDLNTTFSKFGSNTCSGIANNRCDNVLDTTPGIVSKIIGLDTWDLSNVTDYANFFCYNSYLDFGTINIKSSARLMTFFAGTKYTHGTINLYDNPTSYDYIFADSVNDEDRKIVFNYASNVTDIDTILAERGENQFIVKGNLIDN